jgi:outer membrane protein assembly factor BamB
MGAGTLKRRGDMSGWEFNRLVVAQVFLGMVVAASPISGRDVGLDGPTGTADLAQAGLQQMWRSHAEVSGSDQLRFAELHVSNTRATVFFEILVGDQVRHSIASLDRDSLGNPLGFERAQEQAELQREIIEQQVAATLADKSLSLEAFMNLVQGTSPEAVQQRQELLEKANQKVTVRKYVEPRMTLYTLNGQNVLQAFNAETGELRWTRQVGPRSGYSIGVAANDAMVAVVNGGSLYCLDADQGRILWHHRCDGPPNAPPAMSHKHIFVPLMDGRVEAFDIAADGIVSEYYVSYGRINASPLVTGRTVSWPTDQGYYNVAYFEEIGPIKYRVRALESIMAAPARLGRIFFIGAMDGYVYAVDEILGSIYWEFSTGSSISQSPLAVGEGVYVVTDNQELFKLEAHSGISSPNWPRSIKGIHRLIGAANQFIYAQDVTGNLVVLRADNGSIVHRLYVGDGIHLLNAQTDRIFLVSRSGDIQCLRQINQIHPQFHVPVSESIASSGGDQAPPRRATPVEEGAANPFETKEALSQNPFLVDEPVYDNPFVVESGGEVNPFAIEPGGQEKTGEQNVEPTDDPFADGQKPEQQEAPPSDSDDPFNSGGGSR